MRLPPDPTDVYQHHRSKAEIIFLTWQTPNAPALRQEIPSVFKNTLPISSALYVLRSSHERTTCAHISELTPTNVHFSAQSVERPLHANTIENDTRDYTLAKRNSFAEEIYQEVEIGVAGAALLALTLLVVTSDPKRAEFALSLFSTKNPKSGIGSLWNSSNSHINRPDISNQCLSPWSCLEFLEWMVNPVAILFSLLRYLRSTRHYKLFSGIKFLLQAKIPVKSAAAVVLMPVLVANLAMMRKILA